MKCIPSIIALSLIALLTTACTTPGNPNAGQPGEVNIRTLRAAGIEVTGSLNPDFSINPSPQHGHGPARRGFDIHSIAARPTETGLPRLHVGIINTGTTRTLVQYRFMWLDDAGIEIEPGTGGWSTLSLAPQEVAQAISVARSTDARSFRLLVQRLEQKR